MNFKSRNLILENHFWFGDGYVVLGRFCSIAFYKRWISRPDRECTVSSHPRNRPSRSPRWKPPLFEGRRGLDCRGSRGPLGTPRRAAPEIVREDIIDSGWIEKWNVYDIGFCIQCIIYVNVHVNGQVEWPVPPPFDSIVEACTRAAVRRLS